MRRVTLISDFGTVDGYVGVMKVVLARRCPEALPMDITHEIPPGDVVKASRVLGRVWHHFPSGTVHLLVVDPGVGTRRRGLAVCSGGHYFVAPDNGLLTPVLQGEGWQAVGLGPSLHLSPVESTTFHGRDLFAPAAGLLASGIPLEELGNPVLDPILLGEVGGDLSRGEGRVVEVDHFGNLATDLPGKSAMRVGWVEAGGVTIPLVGTYGETEKDALLALINSDGLVEIAVRNGSAAERLGIGVGDPVKVGASAP
jgi:S-adenosylmethionine hydrolase